MLLGHLANLGSRLSTSGGGETSTSKLPGLMVCSHLNVLVMKDVRCGLQGYRTRSQCLQFVLQQCVNHELPDVPPGLRKCRETKDQIANILWIIKKATELQRKHLLLLY